MAVVAGKDAGATVLRRIKLTSQISLHATSEADREDLKTVTIRCVTTNPSCPLLPTRNTRVQYFCRYA